VCMESVNCRKEIFIFSSVFSQLNRDYVSTGSVERLSGERVHKYGNCLVCTDGRFMSE
jgi:hypothetical protein